MDKRNKAYTERKNNRKLSKFFEYNVTNFAWVASLILAAIFALAAIDFTFKLSGFELTIHGCNNGILLIAALYAIAGVISLIIALMMKNDIIKTDEVSKLTRFLGILLIPFILCGNIFASFAGFITSVKEKTIEYTLISLAILNTISVMLISLINLFKEYVANTFLIGIYILVALLVIYVIIMFIILYCTKHKEKYKLLFIPAIILILSGITGNVFAIAAGLLILSRIKNINENRNVEWVDVLRRVFRNYTSILGIFFVSLLIGLSICSYLTFDYSIAIENSYTTLLLKPSLMFPFGTDEFGRCVFTRIIFGARISLIVGISVATVPIIVGGSLGAFAGHYGGKLDNTIMRILDVLYAIPSILLAIAIIASFGASTVNLIMSLSVSMIPVYARTMRAQVMIVTSSEYIEAARACGLREGKIIFKHIVPNSVAPIIVRATLSIGSAVLSMSALSFLGLGVEPHIPEWGSILRTGTVYLEQHPYLAIYPGLAIVLIVLAFNYFGDGLRDALDPKLK